MVKNEGTCSNAQDPGFSTPSPKCKTTAALAVM